MRPAFTALALAFLSACATTPQSSETAKAVPPERVYAKQLTEAKTGKGILIITRDVGMMGMACAAKIYIEGERIADLRIGERIMLYLDPGEYIVGVSQQGGICGGGTDQTEAKVTLEKTARLRVAAGQSGDLKIEPSAF